MPSYKSKTIIAGNHIRRLDCSVSILYGFENKKSNYEKKTEGEKKDYSLRRTQDNLVLTIDCNVNKYSKFLTLTFRSPVLERDEAMKYFNSFQKFFKREFNEVLRYVGVTERQKKRGINENNEGSWHFHLVVFNSRKLDFEKLKSAWPYGSVDIKKIDKVENLGRYLGKYLSKGNENGLNKKSVLKSRGLKEPIELKNEIPYSDMVQTYQRSYERYIEETGEIIQYTITDYIITKAMNNQQK